MTVVFQFKFCAEDGEQAIISSELILKYLESDLPYTDSLDKHFSFSVSLCYPSINNDAYQSLKSTYGLHLIKNDSIRRGLEIYQNEWITLLGERQETYFTHTVTPAVTELFMSNEYHGKMTPYDYDALKKSNKYKHILRTLIANRKLQINFWKQFSQYRQEVSDLIEAELNKE